MEVMSCVAIFDIWLALHLLENPLKEKHYMYVLWILLGLSSTSSSSF
jgi:hypothetical protein